MLREGFTTGSAAAAAAKAALTLLLGSVVPAKINIALPPFRAETSASQTFGISPAQNLSPAFDKHLLIPIASCRLEKTADDTLCATAVVIKDGGDDPDATHGMRIEMTAAFAPFQDSDAMAQSNWLALGADVYLKAGTGIGIVTLPGLPVPPGEAAINPEPRRQIAFAAREAAAAAAYNGPVYLLLRAPEGAERAARTLNARLGIKQGISILGTRGIVRPYSHDAWQATIIQSLDVAVALGISCIGMSTGRRSEQALQVIYPQLPEQAFSLVADFARFSIQEAVRRGFSKIIWGCYCGKLLKLAQGLEYTHAKSAGADLDLLIRLAAECGAPDEVLQRLPNLPTAQGIFDLLETAETQNNLVTQKLAARLAKLALANLCAWAMDALQPKAGIPEISICLFKPDNSLLYKSRNG